jgi:hypothetical protein
VEIREEAGTMIDFPIIDSHIHLLDQKFVLGPGFLEAIRLAPKYNLSFDVCAAKATRLSV